MSRTRCVVPAMVPWRSNEAGEVTPAVLDWYGRFADGWPGVLVVEATGIRDVPSGPLLRIGHDRYLPGLRELVRVVRERSDGRTRLFIQLIDFLRIRRRPERETYLRRFLSISARLRAALAARAESSHLAGLAEDELRAGLVALPHELLLELLEEREREALEFGARERVWDTQEAHIAALPRELPRLFAEAAERARLAGFDGVELHYAHAYTMASFLSRLNTRADGYGGDLRGRLRLPLEVFQAVRERVGADFCVGCRFLGDEVIEGGSRIEEAVEYGRAFAAAGMDYLSVSKGGKFEDARQPKVGQAAYPYTGPSGHECMPTVFADEPGPFGRNLPLAQRIRAAIRADGRATPIVAAGGIADFDLAQAALLGGSCDLVGSARQSLADPDWWRKMETGAGESIRRCLFTNYCEALDQRHLEVSCQLWDREFGSPDPPAAGGAGGSGGSAPGRPEPQPERISMSADGKRRLIAPR